MNTRIALDAKSKAVAANLELLHALLMDAANRSAEAHDLIQHGERNAAIGVVAELDAVLDDAKALHGAALALHRTRLIAPWRLAKNAESPRKMELIENAEGVPVYAFTINDMCIDNPRLSECGRFIVDPTEHYGLRPEEVSALEEANSLLRAEREKGHAQQGRATRNGEQTAGTTVPSLADVRGLYPSMGVWHTGGGCFALRHDCDDGGYLLITQCADAQVPADDATEVDVGRFAANGDIVEGPSSISVEKLKEWIDAALGRASDPKNVADYFVKKLGASPVDDSLRELSIDSPCGQDCVKAIDAAAALSVHVRAAFGTHGAIWCTSGRSGDHREFDAVEIARQVIGVYWRG